MSRIAVPGLLSALVVSILLLAPPAARPAPAAEPWQAKSLKILPKDITKDEIKTVMKKQADALGVDCDHCHAVPEMDKDTEKKARAREMMRMVAEVNAKYFKGKAKVGCITCHRGKDEPDVKP